MSIINGMEWIELAEGLVKAGCYEYGMNSRIHYNLERNLLRAFSYQNKLSKSLEPKWHATENAMMKFRFLYQCFRGTVSLSDHPDYVSTERNALIFMVKQI